MSNENRRFHLKVPGSAWLPLAVFTDLFLQVRTDLGVSIEQISRETGIPEQVIQNWETHEPGSLLLKQIVPLLQCLDCRLEIRLVRNKPRPDEPFAGLQQK